MSDWLYCDGSHVWEDKPSDPKVLDVYACAKCIASARKVDDQMVVIMCSHPDCTNPAWRIQEPEDRWVCESHYIGVILL